MIIIPGFVSFNPLDHRSIECASGSTNLNLETNVKADFRVLAIFFFSWP